MHKSFEMIEVLKSMETFICSLKFKTCSLVSPDSFINQLGLLDCVLEYIPKSTIDQ